MEERYKTLLKASLSFAIGIAGLIYISKMPTPEPKYNSVEIKVQNYTLVDADEDGDVDIIKPNNGVKGKTYVDKNMLKKIREYDRFFDMYGYARPMSPNLQEQATKVFHKKQNASKLENKIK